MRIINLARAHTVLALCRFGFIYSLSSSSPFLLPGCLTSYPVSENVQERCIVFMPVQGSTKGAISENLYISELCFFLIKRAFLGYRETCEGQQDSFFL